MREAFSLRSLELNWPQRCELEMLMGGAYSPLAGFMTRAQFEFCLKSAINHDVNLLLHPRVGGDIAGAPCHFGLMRSFLAIRERFPAPPTSCRRCRRGEDLTRNHAATRAP